MKGKKFIGLALCVLLGIGVGFGLSWLMNTFWTEGKIAENALLKLLVTILLLYVFLVIHLILHEGGHWLFGLLSGYKFSSFRIFSFMWVRIEGKIRLKKLSIAGTGGQCLMQPPPLIDGKIPVTLYNLGGVLVNMVTSTVALIPAFLLKDTQFAAVCLGMFACVGYVLGLTNGIPMRVGQVDNDGENALSLRKNPKAIYAFWLQMQINSQIAQGVRLKDMPAEWFAMPSEEDLHNSMLATQAVFRENYLMDCLAFDEAKTLVERLIAEDTAVVGIHKNLLKCDLIFLCLAVFEEKERVPSLWTKELTAFLKSMKKFPTVLRTRYVYKLLYEGKVFEAKEVLAEFDKMAVTYPYVADIQSERELLALADKRRERVEE